MPNYRKSEGFASRRRTGSADVRRRSQRGLASPLGPSSSVREALKITVALQRADIPGVLSTRLILLSKIALPKRKLRFEPRKGRGFAVNLFLRQCPLTMVV